MSERQFNEAITSLLADAPMNDLGPGRPVSARRSQLRDLSPQAIVAPASLANREMGLACLAGLWLRFDCLDESHQISQTIDSPTGSYWHGIMHRREPDFANAKYWFRRVGQHPIEPALLVSSQSLAREGQPIAEATFLVEQSRWDASRFVDLCAVAGERESPLRQLCVKIQQSEWQLLFEYCFRAAIGFSE